MNWRNAIAFVLAFILVSTPTLSRGQESMDKLWGSSVVKLHAENAERGQLFFTALKTAAVRLGKSMCMNQATTIFHLPFPVRVDWSEHKAEPWAVRHRAMA